MPAYAYPIAVLNEAGEGLGIGGYRSSLSVWMEDLLNAP